MIGFRAFRRRLAFGLPTILGLRRRGFFLPYRYADSGPEPGTRPPIEAVETLFRAAEPAFREHLALVDDDQVVQAFPPDRADHPFNEWVLPGRPGF